MITSPSNKVFLTVDKTKNDFYKHGSLELVNPGMTETQFDNAIQEGVVYSMPSYLKYKDYKGDRVEKRNDVKVEKGDKIYFHHFVVQDDCKINHEEQELYICDYESVYCMVKDGKIEMMEDYILVAPITEDESKCKTASGIWIKIEPDKIYLYGKIKHINPFYESIGLKEGQNIFFTKNSEYKITVEGTEYYRMKIEDIACVVNEDGTLSALKGKVICEQYVQQEIKTESGIILPPVIENKSAKITRQKVLFSAEEEIKVNDFIHYEKGRCDHFEFNGKKFSMVRADEILIAETI